MQAANQNRPAHNALLWQRAVLALCALALVGTAISIRTGSIMSDSQRGFLLDNSYRYDTALVATVTYVTPGGAAERAGLRAGDRIDLRRLSSGDRLRVEYGVSAGEPLTLPVTRDGRRLTIQYRGGYVPIRWDVWLIYIGTIWSVLIAGLLMWRRAEQIEARILSLLLLTLNVPALISPGNWTSGSAALDFGLNIVSAIGGNLEFALLAAYALLFARPPTPGRLILTALTYALAILLTILAIVGEWALWSGVTPPAAFLDSTPVRTCLEAAIWYLPLICVFAAARRAAGAQRQRILWTSATIGLYFALYGAENVIFAALPALASSPVLRLLQMGLDFVSFIIPIGVAYGVLNRRLLDVGFALNRAAVFSVVSIIIVGLFVLIEWALSEWMRNAGHETNIAVSGALALLLGLSIRFVHGKVEHVVDNVIFRKRRNDEEAIRQMAREAPYITDVATLIERVRQTLMRHADASHVTMLLDGGNGRFGETDENDPALVSLRADHARVDLHAVSTAIDGEWAYPMVARGRLIGALVLGAKRSQESYAPDESGAIAQLANSVGAALDVLDARRESSNVNATLERILAAVQRLSPEGG